jgi:hypothetical protein
VSLELDKFVPIKAALKSASDGIRAMASQLTSAGEFDKGRALNLLSYDGTGLR